MPVGWDEIESAAAGMFDIWTSGGDLAFAREAWEHLRAAGLADDDTPALATQARLRLIALYRIYEGFCLAKWNENPDTPIAFLAEDLQIDRLALGLLAAPHMHPGDWLAVDEFEMYEVALAAAVKALRPEVLDCLKKAYGGDSALYQRLSRTRSNNDEYDDRDWDIEGGDVDGYAYVKYGGDI